jgi:predicted nucleic acid-binding protein
MVRFWDTSALVSLVLEEPRSDACRRLLRDKAGVVVWTLTRTEMISAVWQRSRMGTLPSATLAKALGRIDALAKGWSEISDVEPVRNRAERLFAQHDLRAADALQLAAALVLWRDRPRGHAFVTGDGALARAASAEGFQVLIQK